MAKRNTTVARQVPASEVIKGETAITSGSVTTEEYVRDMGVGDNPAPDAADDGSNKGPLLGDYHAQAESQGEAVHNLFEVVKDMRATTRKAGTIFDQMAVAIADYGSFLTAKDGKLPDLKSLKKSFLDVVNGKVFAVHDSESGKWSIETRKETTVTKGRGNKSNAPKIVNASEKFMGVATNTFNSYVEPACKAAILVLIGAAGTATTYRKGLRYSDHTKEHNVGDPVLFKMTSIETKAEYYVPWPIDGDGPDQPQNAYIGIIWNDHELHPFLEIEGGEGEGKYLDKKAYAFTKNKPWLGLSADSVKIHYARFIGDKTDDNGIPVPMEVIKETGMPVKATRETGGTQSETTSNADDKATAKITIVDVDKIGLVDFLKQAITVVKNLPKKDTAPVYTDEIRDLLAELNRIVDENVSERGEGEADETLDKAMNA